jgi:quercetin dioxygenase-like cupin family protein
VEYTRDSTARKVSFMKSTTRTCHPGEGSKALNRLPQLADPFLQFDLVSELQQLRGEESWQRETGRSSKTLAKYPDFRIVLVLMKANTQMKEHRAEGRISIHHLLGKIRVHLPDQKVSLTSGQLMVLDCGMVHDVEALEESAFLLTVSWPKGTSES